METITDQLNSLVASVSLINEAKRKGILSSLLSSFDFEPKSKSESQLKEALDWFVDGGLFTSYWKESVPYGERKNSKKKRSSASVSGGGKTIIADEITCEQAANLSQAEYNKLPRKVQERILQGIDP